MTRMLSVACRSIPRPDGNGAVGCGHGWCQPDSVIVEFQMGAEPVEHRGPLVCPRCGRDLVITGTWVEVPLDRVTPPCYAQTH